MNRSVLAVSMAVLVFLAAGIVPGQCWLGKNGDTILVGQRGKGDVIKNEGKGDLIIMGKRKGKEVIKHTGKGDLIIMGDSGSVIFAGDDEIRF